MKWRLHRGQLITAAVLVLLGLLVNWIAHNTYWREVEAPLRLRGPAAINPFYAAQRLAGLLGARTQWRHDTLQLPSPRGVILADDWSFSRVPGTADRALEHWVTAGGRLVLDNRIIAGREELARWAGIERVPLPDEDRVPQRLQQSSAIAAGADPDPWGAPRHYQLCCLNRFMQVKTRTTPTWTLADEDGHILGARVTVGRGSVTFINGTPFTTEALLSDGAGADDQALLLVEALQLSRGDTLWFLSDAEGPTLLGLTWRTGWPVVVLVLGWVALWLWRSGPRFGPLEAPPSTARRSLGEQIRGTGQFTLRVGGGRALLAAAAHALTVVAGRRIAGFGSLPPARQAQEVSRLTGVPTAALAQALGTAGPLRRRDLYARLLALESARRALLTPAHKVITHAD